MILRPRYLAAAVFAAASSPAIAFAHHAMDGETPRTIWQAALSGLAHPIIGWDHAAFVLAVGLLSAILDARSAPAWFVAGTIAGSVLHVAGVSLPGVEILIAGTVVGAGIAVAAARSDARIPVAAVLAAAGVLHGYAYGESIIGAEPGPLAAYLLGFGAVQLVIATGAAVAYRRSSRVRAVRGVAGGGLALVGCFAIWLAV